MRQSLLTLIRNRNRGRWDGASPPRPDDGYERVVLDSNDQIIIDGVPIGQANLDPDRGSRNPLKFVLWIIMILFFGAAATGYLNNLPDRIQDFVNEFRQPAGQTPRTQTPRSQLPRSQMPELPETSSERPIRNGTAPDDAAPDNDDFDEAPLNDPLSKKTY
ncbi:MAG: hypothetical protein JKY32_04365 [Rhizobiales bacterium]|nr:hypothetical protein [Hyphomicrobiales bacterium]